MNVKIGALTHLSLSRQSCRWDSKSRLPERENTGRAVVHRMNGGVDGNMRSRTVGGIPSVSAHAKVGANPDIAHAAGPGGIACAIEFSRYRDLVPRCSVHRLLRCLQRDVAQDRPDV